MKDIYLIVAMTKNRVIGQKGDIPWHISDDLKLFKKLTTGGVVIMGRKTYESIGKPLPDRLNIVISSSVKEISGCEVFSSVLLAANYASQTGKKVFFIGGGELYKAAMALADHLYISWVKEEHDGDTYFPQFDLRRWKEEESEEYQEFVWKHYTRL